MQKDILFIDAACKSREKFLLGEDKLNRLIEAGSFEDGLRLLKEYGFGKNAKEGATLSEIIFADEEELISFIKEYSPKGTLINYFLLPYDFINGEALLKCKKLNLPEEKYLTHEGLLTINQIKNGFVEGGTTGLKELDEAINESLKLFEEATPTGAQIDAVFTNCLYAAIKRTVKDKVAIRMLQFETDLKNISSALRSESFEEYLSVKIPYGTLSEEDDKALITKDPSVIAARFKNTALFGFIEAALPEIGKPLVNYEKTVESFCLKKLKETRYFIRGTEPFFLYVMYRKADIKNVRLVMVSLINGIDKQIVKSKLRESY